MKAFGYKFCLYEKRSGPDAWFLFADPFCAVFSAQLTSLKSSGKPADIFTSPIPVSEALLNSSAKWVFLGGFGVCFFLAVGFRVAWADRIAEFPIYWKSISLELYLTVFCELIVCLTRSLLSLHSKNLVFVYRELI